MDEKILFDAQVPRKNPRVTTNVRVSFSGQDSLSKSALLQNISLGGICLCCEDPQDVGKIIQLELPLEEGLFLKLQGSVTWVNRSSPSEMGIRFLFETSPTPAHHKKTLEDFIERLLSHQIDEQELIES